MAREAKDASGRAIGSTSPKGASAGSLAMTAREKEVAMVCLGLGAQGTAPTSIDLSSTERGLARRLVVRTMQDGPGVSKRLQQSRGGGGQASPRRDRVLQRSASAAMANDITKRYLQPQMSNAPIPLSFHIESFAHSVVNPASKPSSTMMRSKGAPMGPPVKALWSSMVQLPAGLVGDFHVAGTNPGFSRTPYGGFYTNYK